jgi:hypothetical protein
MLGSLQIDIANLLAKVASYGGVQMQRIDQRKVVLR